MSRPQSPDPPTQPEHALGADESAAHGAQAELATAEPIRLPEQGVENFCWADATDAQEVALAGPQREKQEFIRVRDQLHDFLAQSGWGAGRAFVPHLNVLMKGRWPHVKQRLLGGVAMLPASQPQARRTAVLRPELAMPINGSPVGEELRQAIWDDLLDHVPRQLGVSFRRPCLHVTARVEQSGALEVNAGIFADSWIMKLGWQHGFADASVHVEDARAGSAGRGRVRSRRSHRHSLRRQRGVVHGSAF